ncbi:MAG: glycosyltransferase family 2 protein [Ruminococcus sp.]|nr:glycosyltransferase family 2 protein [Ruminococcus sp.]
MNGQDCNLSISVAVCTYNGETFIRKQIQSILEQSVPVDEIIICDDGSLDNTLTVAESILCDSSVKYKIEKNSPNVGVTKNFEKCIALCSGDLIFTADQDDIWKADKVEKMRRAFLEDESCVMAFSDANIVDAAGKEIMPSLYKKDGFLQGDFSYQKYIDEILRLNYTVYGCTMVFRRDFIFGIMPFVESAANHDAWIMCCAGFFGNVTYVSEQLISYRIHGSNQVGSISGNKKWDSIIYQQDEFDRYFAIQSLRDIRIRLIDMALKRNPDIHNKYARQCYLARSFYEVIISLKKMSPVFRILRLSGTLLNGSYRYRFCDRNRKFTFGAMIKMIPYDIIFLLKWKNEK